MNPSALADRLCVRIPGIMDAAANDLGLPRPFVFAQLNFAAEAIAAVEANPFNNHEERNEVAFLFPANTEGGMALYLIAKARAMGWRVRAKISTRARAIFETLAECLSPDEGVTLDSVPGAEFLHNAIRDQHVRYVQVFGDNGWIDGYRLDVVHYGKLLAFDGPGKDALVVLEGADVTKAVDVAVELGLFAGGAACMSAERFIVHQSIAGSFQEQLAERLSEIRPIPPWEGDGMLGLASSQKAVARMADQITDAVAQGARLVLGSPNATEIRSPSGKSFYACKPTVLVNVPARADILQHETFGPVFPLVTFSGGLSQAIACADDTDYGLTATVFGPAEEAARAAEVLRTSHAIAYANGSMLTDFRPEYWGSGGFKKSGWVWQTNPATGTLSVRHGFRTLSDELAAAL